MYGMTIVLSPNARSSIKDGRNMGVGSKLTSIQLASRQMNLRTDGRVALRWSLEVMNSFTPIWAATKGLGKLCTIFWDLQTCSACSLTAAIQSSNHVRRH